jgi:hypothetical protein
MRPCAISVTAKSSMLHRFIGAENVGPAADRTGTRAGPRLAIIPRSGSRLH